MLSLLSVNSGFTPRSHRHILPNSLHLVLKTICSRGGNSGSVVQGGGNSSHPYVPLSALQKASPGAKLSLGHEEGESVFSECIQVLEVFDHQVRR